MRSKRAERPWAIAQVRVGSAAPVLAGRVADDRLPKGLRLDVLRFDTRRLVPTWFGTVDRLMLVTEREARRAALPRAAQPCASAAPFD